MLKKKFKTLEGPIYKNTKFKEKFQKKKFKILGGLWLQCFLADSWGGKLANLFYFIF